MDELIMHKSILSLVVVAPFLWACGASFPVPPQRMADAQSAERSALQLGANNEPDAQLSLRLAQDQIAMAKTAINDGDNQRADSLLIRAKADAELAVVKARDKGAKIDVQKAVDDSAAQKATNAGQGAVK
ncbi:MAG TPA: DUF4398 domain-containing protein [Polyangiaceae bacterium]